jgi:eukaryotic-like serine/threonine-protein kinase
MLQPNGHWARVKWIHQAVLDRPANERADFLTERCAGDQSLRRDVESLLAHETTAESFLETPAFEVIARGLSERDSTHVGRVLGHYRIVSFLGSGGMGEVYLAHDPRLDRTVAVKILPEHFASDADRMERFAREAKAASALNHPNVATVYDIGESAGIRYIVMEHVDGETLVAKISGRPLPVIEAIDIAMQAADALDAAHAKGIIHRDIKPANLMVTPRGQVKVLDFGIAKTTQAEQQGATRTSEWRNDAQTAAGNVIGSASHMSPEQIAGARVDGRTDLFSLGVVMYEMLTGRLPFAGTSVADVRDRILHAPAESITQVNGDVPPALERLTCRCLEKSVERRYQSARELLTDLRELKRQIDSGVSGSKMGAESRQIASSRPLEAYELVGRGRRHLLSGSFFELPQAAAAFQAATALDPTYAAAHAGLALALCGEGITHAVPHRDAFAKAKASALRALALEDTCADAHVALGQVLFLSEWDWAAAERSFQRALDINPNHPEASLHYGGLLEALGRLDQGLQLKHRALERDPTYELALFVIAVSMWNQRRYDDALSWTGRVLQRDPTHLQAHELRGGVYFKKGELVRALAEDRAFAEALGASDEKLAAIETVGREIKGAFDAGGHREMVRCILRHLPDEAGRASSGVRLPVLYAEAGDLDAAFTHLDRALESREPGLVHLAVAPQWDALRQDSRFHSALARMGLHGAS